MDQRPQSLRKERQAKREIRRQQQRAASVVRAAKMGAARLDAKSSSNREVTCPSAGSVKGGSFYVGCSGWYYWQWRGRFYPADIPVNEWLGHYMSQFRTVELNAPFYAWPTIATVKTWKRQVGRKKFRYSVKVSDLITHVHRFKGTGELVKNFGYIANLLGESMGCFLFQLPRDYEYTAANLRAILSQLDPQKRNVVEFRHPSWWKERVFGAFRETGTIFCSCSAPGLPDALVTTATDVYIRFHGISRWYRHNYSGQELDRWADRILDSGATTVWAYFNNTSEGDAARNAQQFLRRLKRQC
jgi:uncharacterized protein YecE (DUF72 family)